MHKGFVAEQGIGLIASDGWKVASCFPFQQQDETQALADQPSAL